MSLALVQVPLSDFNRIHNHVSTHTRHRNMHLREARVRQRRRALYYLHALYAPATGHEIEGMISGPNLYWHYRLKPSASQASVQVQVLTRPRSSPQDAVRLQGRFLRDILDRIRHEQSGVVHYPRRLQGQFYLRRGSPGMPVSHPHCLAATANGELDPRFLVQLHPWNLELLHP